MDLTVSHPPRYTDEYADVLTYVHHRDICLAELRLFHFWIHVCAHQHATCVESPVWPIPSKFIPPRDVDDIPIAMTLGRPLDQLLKTRFELYTRFFLDGRQADDPLGLRAAALALACQLCVHPPQTLRQRLERDAVHRFFRATHASTTRPLSLTTVAPAHHS